MMKASSLFYAIVISLIIAITTSSFLLSAYYNRIQADTFEINQKLQLNATSGYNFLLSQQTTIAPNEEKIIDLFGNGDDSVFLELKSWGVYEIAISKAMCGNRTSTRIGQVGYYTDSKSRYCIYLADKDKPLSLCGNTLLKGTAFLPEAGVKRAYIEGQSFVGNTLIDGEVKQSKQTIPSPDKTLIDKLQLCFSTKSFNANDSIIVLENGLSGDTINNSFFNRTLVFASQPPIDLISGSYTGNIVIISDDIITITQSVSLKDIIVFAPQIKIKSGFRGNIQAFASDSILVEPEVTLAYPSVLGILQKNTNKNPSHIILNKKDSIAGNIFICKDETLMTTQPSGLILPEEAFVLGQVYLNGYGDIKGTIKGSIMCDQLLLSTPSSVYENHLLNAVIDVTQLPDIYTSIALLEESPHKRTVKWLN